MDAKNRNLENKINELLNMFPVVIILGARQCGKSTIAKKIRPKWKYYDLENVNDFELINQDPQLFFKNNHDSIIIDEAQKSSVLFETLRGIVDGHREKKGRFILTGSGSLDLMKNVSETLAGRVGVVELGSFKVNEAFDKPLSHFYKIFTQKISSSSLDLLCDLNASVDHNQLMEGFFRGGYPEPFLSSYEFQMQWMENYFNQYINRDMRLMFPKLDIIKYKRVVAMLSSLNGTIINKAEIARSTEISERVVKDYMDIISGTFFWRELPSFQSSKIKTTQKLAKGHFVDSGLALFLQNVHSKDELFNFPAVGRFFESFIVEEIIKGVQSLMTVNTQFFHLRTKAGGEIDLVVTGPFGTLPIEIKYGSSTKKKELKFLNSFIDLHELPFGIVINNSDRIEMLTEKIIQIPATYI